MWISAAGFLSDTRLVRVRDLSVRIHGPDEIGESLQETYVEVVSPAPTSDLTVTISVPDTDNCAVAGTENSLASASITRTIPAGRRRFSLVVQGVASGDCAVSVDAASFQRA